MTIDKTLTEAGVDLNDFNKPVGSPTKTMFATVISTLRKTESAMLKQQSDTSGKLADSERRLAIALEKIKLLEAQVRETRLKEEASRLELKRDDTRRILEAATVS